MLCPCTQGECSGRDEQDVIDWLKDLAFHLNENDLGKGSEVNEWTSGGVTERFFDYVPKGKRAVKDRVS